ncbi:MAG: DUF4845 domain-containing protein [Rhodocyclaceae bacterium]|jgi:hypothetical protein|nr:DUF4845 domain-containing protein [Rhodocyclaceae bacterium]
MSLSGLLVAAFAVALLALLGMKVIPEYIEYRQVVASIKKVTAAAGPDTSVRQIREAFDRQANVDYISAITGADLDVTKEGGRIVVSFSYEKRIPLFANVSLLLDFSGSSKE